MFQRREMPVSHSRPTGMEVWRQLCGLQMLFRMPVCHRLVDYPVTDTATEKLCKDIASFREKAGMTKHVVKKEQLISWKILKQQENTLLATNAYVLLTSDYFPFSKTQCAVFKGKERAVFLDKREFTGPVYMQIEEAVEFVMRNIRLGAVIDGLIRKEKYELPPEAIREMIINAHCYRNLMDESCIQIALYDDRLEITSSGRLYNGLTYEEVMSGHSRIRNKGIANIFSQMGLVEAWGSGIRRIYNAAKEYGLPEPEIREFDNMFRIELFRNVVQPQYRGKYEKTERIRDSYPAWLAQEGVLGDCRYLQG